MASCKLCDSLSAGGNDGTTISDGEKIDHAKFHLKQNKFIDDGDQRTLEEILGSCFGEKILAENGGEDESTNPSHHQKNLYDYCRQLFGQRPQFRRVACNLCDSEIQVFTEVGRGFLNAPHIVDHASVHLDAKRFECVRCNRRFTRKGGVTDHVRKAHRVKKPTAEDFMDRSSEFHDQMMDMIKNCFAGCKQATMSKDEAKSKKMENMIRNRHDKDASKFAVERHLLCYRLITKIVDKEGKIECRVCSKRIVVKIVGGIQSANALAHVERHLKKPMYRCIQCGKLSATPKSIRYHLRTKHAMTLANNYEDNSDNYHEEIMAMLSKCFEGTTPSDQSQQSKSKRRRSKMLGKVAPIHRGNSAGSASSSEIGTLVKTAATSSTTHNQHHRIMATNSSATSMVPSEKKKSEKNIRKRSYSDSGHDRGSCANGSSSISAQSIGFQSKKTAATQTETTGASINPFDEVISK